MAASWEDNGRCDEEDLVKSFLPSLFDSDSEAEDLYFFQSLSSNDTSRAGPPLAQTSPEQSATSAKLTSVLTSPMTKANSTSLLHLSRQQEALVDAGSPHSQGNSSLTVFQNSTLESCSSVDDQSPFHSMLSLTSSSSVSLLETDSLEGSPLKRRKVEWKSNGHSDSIGSETYGKANLDSNHPPPSGFQQPMADYQKQCSPGIGHTAFGLAACLPGGITTGVPVDSCPMTIASMCKSLPMARSSPAHVAAVYTSAWPSNPQPLPHQGVQNHLPSTWRSPQAMIPTISAAPTNAHHSSSFSPQIAPLEGAEKITAALSEINRTPLGLAPLGLKLDKLGVMHQLKGMGVKMMGK